ncbi:MAG: hypothetical protein R3B81_12030 [bacterium]
MTLTIRREGAYPPVLATHVELTALASEEPGVISALLTGRFPSRTRAGTEQPIALPGGGGLSRYYAAPAVPVLTRAFPRVMQLEGTVFAPTASVASLARASGLPVLGAEETSTLPPHFLRLLEIRGETSDADAQAWRDQGAWLDVTLRDDGTAELALTGQGIALGQVQGTANLIDVAPTVLHLLGLAVPRDCDGRVLLEVLDPIGPGGRPIRYRDIARRPDAKASITST